MTQQAINMAPVVFVVDDDIDVREGLKSVMGSVGLRCEVFASTSEIPAAQRPADTVSCLVLDVRLPEMSGLDFQAELAGTHADIPIIFITGHGDIPMSRQGDEGRRGRIPHQAGARAGPARCRARRPRT